MEEIEVRDFVRLKQGYIGTVENINDFREPSMKYVVDIQKIDLVFVGDDDIVKHSKIISEVVNVGDYVNGKLIHKIDKGPNYCYLYYGNCKTFVDYQIKTILTKESYMANCYKVGGERKCM